MAVPLDAVTAVAPVELQLHLVALQALLPLHSHQQLLLVPAGGPGPPEGGPLACEKGVSQVEGAGGAPAGPARVGAPLLTRDRPTKQQPGRVSAAWPWRSGAGGQAQGPSGADGRDAGEPRKPAPRKIKPRKEKNPFVRREGKKLTDLRNSKKTG